LLDKEAIDFVLGQGLDINKTMNDEFSPIMEICTSRLLFLYEHPDAPRLAGQHAAAQGSGADGIKIDNDDILKAESLEDIQVLFANSLEDAANKRTQQTSYALSDKERQSQLVERLELIDYLVEQGLDIDIAQEKAPFAFVDHVASMNSPEILQALVHKGFSLAPERGYKEVQLHAALTNEHFAIIDPLLQLGHRWRKLKRNYPELVQSYLNWKTKHDVVELQLGAPKPGRKKAAKTTKAVRKTKWTWELAGESILLAQTEPKHLKHEKPVIVRVTHSNIYGPFDDAKLYVRIGDPDMPTAFEDIDGGSEWHPLVLVEELLIVDGDEVDRSSLKEPVYGETPWEGTFECELKIAAGKHSIEIKVVSETDGMNGVISDWIVNVK
jgi:hypothetical protein